MKDLFIIPAIGVSPMAEKLNAAWDNLTGQDYSEVADLKTALAESQKQLTHYRALVGKTGESLDRARMDAARERQACMDAVKSLQSHRDEITALKESLRKGGGGIIMNESKTPRTDESIAKANIPMGGWTLLEKDVIPLARQLETELAASRAEARLWERRYDEQTSTAALTAQERDASKAREDKLASAMSDIANTPLGMLSPEYAMFDIASAALEAWRAAK